MPPAVLLTVPREQFKELVLACLTVMRYTDLDFETLDPALLNPETGELPLFGQDRQIASEEIRKELRTKKIKPRRKYVELDEEQLSLFPEPPRLPPESEIGSHLFPHARACYAGLSSLLHSTLPHDWRGLSTHAFDAAEGLRHYINALQHVDEIDLRVLNTAIDELSQFESVWKRATDGEPMFENITPTATQRDQSRLAWITLQRAKAHQEAKVIANSFNELGIMQLQGAQDHLHRLAGELESVRPYFEEYGFSSMMSIGESQDRVLFRSLRDDVGQRRMALVRGRIPVDRRRLPLPGSLTPAEYVPRAMTHPTGPDPQRTLLIDDVGGEWLFQGASEEDVIAAKVASALADRVGVIPIIRPYAYTHDGVDGYVFGMPADRRVATDSMTNTYLGDLTRTQMDDLIRAHVFDVFLDTRSAHMSDFFITDNIDPNVTPYMAARIERRPITSAFGGGNLRPGDLRERVWDTYLNALPRDNIMASGLWSDIERGSARPANVNLHAADSLMAELAGMPVAEFNDLIRPYVELRARQDFENELLRHMHPDLRPSLETLQARWYALFNTRRNHLWDEMTSHYERVAIDVQRAYIPPSPRGDIRLEAVNERGESVNFRVIPDRPVDEGTPVFGPDEGIMVFDDQDKAYMLVTLGDGDAGMHAVNRAIAANRLQRSFIASAPELISYHNEITDTWSILYSTVDRPTNELFFETSQAYIDSTLRNHMLDFVLGVHPPPTFRDFATAPPWGVVRMTGQYFGRDENFILDVQRLDPNSTYGIFWDSFMTTGIDIRPDVIDALARDFENIGEYQLRNRLMTNRPGGVTEDEMIAVLARVRRLRREFNQLYLDNLVQRQTLQHGVTAPMLSDARLAQYQDELRVDEDLVMARDETSEGWEGPLTLHRFRVTYDSAAAWREQAAWELLLRTATPGEVARLNTFRPRVVEYGGSVGILTPIHGRPVTHPDHMHGLMSTPARQQDLLNHMVDDLMLGVSRRGYDFDFRAGADFNPPMRWTSAFGGPVSAQFRPLSMLDPDQPPYRALLSAYIRGNIELDIDAAINRARRFAGIPGTLVSQDIDSYVRALSTPLQATGGGLRDQLLEQFASPDTAVTFLQDLRAQRRAFDHPLTAPVTNSEREFIERVHAESISRGLDPDVEHHLQEQVDQFRAADPSATGREIEVFEREVRAQLYEDQAGDTMADLIYVMPEGDKARAEFILEQVRARVGEHWRGQRLPSMPPHVPGEMPAAPPLAPHVPADGELPSHLRTSPIPPDFRTARNEVTVEWQSGYQGSGAAMQLRFEQDHPDFDLRRFYQLWDSETFHRLGIRTHSVLAWDGSELHLNTHFYSPDGTQIGHSARSYNPGEGSAYGGGASISQIGRDVHGNQTRIRGEGIGRELYASQARFLDTMGITRIRTSAQEYGAYVWARMGFDFTSSHDLSRHRESLINRLSSKRMELRHRVTEAINAREAGSLTRSEMDAVIQDALESIDYEFATQMDNVRHLNHAWELAAYDYTFDIKGFENAFGDYLRQPHHPPLLPEGLHDGPEEWLAKLEQLAASPGHNQPAIQAEIERLQRAIAYFSVTGKEVMMGSSWGGILDLTPGSPSREVLEQYVATKKLPHQPRRDPLPHEQDMYDENIDPETGEYYESDDDDNYDEDDPDY